MEKNTALSNLTITENAASLAENARDMAVLAARDAGASWAEIALPLTITRQAAQQRYGSAEARDRIERKAAAIARGPAEAERVLEEIRANATARWTAPNTDTKPETPSMIVDDPAPAKPAKVSRKVAAKAPATATDDRPSFKLESAGKINGVAQPGTGKGPHACPRCGCTNHKG